MVALLVPVWKFPVPQEEGRSHWRSGSRNSAGELVLDTNISIIPAGDDGSGSLALALGLNTSSFDDFQPDTFTWDPSQEPIKMMNSILCVFSKNGYYNFPNAGPYLANVSMDDCFRSQGGESGLELVRQRAVLRDKVLIPKTLQ